MKPHFDRMVDGRGRSTLDRALGGTFREDVTRSKCSNELIGETRPDSFGLDGSSGSVSAIPSAGVRHARAEGSDADSHPQIGKGAHIRVLRPGVLPYGEGLALQEKLVVKRRGGAISDTLVLLEHDAVVTLGRGADHSHVLFDKTRLAARGIELYETGRGGDVTIHSPGQVVGYPILALEGTRRDTHLYLRDLEEVMIRAAADVGVEAARTPGLTGIWVGGEKLGAIGVRLNSGWITSHGFAFNVANDLSLFSLIVPCGIVGRGVTSLSRLLGRTVAVEEAMDCLASRFLEVFRSDSAEILFGSAPALGERPPTSGAGSVAR